MTADTTTVQPVPVQAIRTMLTTVAAATDITRHLRRITFRGGDLATFEVLGPETFLYLLLPPPGRTELTIDQNFTWDQYATMSAEAQPVGAYYTVRHWRPDAAELDIDVVLHQPSGLASEWAATAQLGQPVALWGPRQTFKPPPDTTSFLLVVDDTGVPAAATIVESFTASQTATVIAETANEADRPPFPHVDGVTVQWIYRHGQPAGTNADLITGPLRRLAPTCDGTYAWGAGESHVMTAARRVLRRELAWDQHRVNMVAYWRHRNTPPTDDSCEEAST
jgi:NADPH-dependent ferric siderophore reductase